MTSAVANIFLPANDVNTTRVQASSWPQRDSSWYPTPLTPHDTGEGNLPVLMNIITLWLWTEQDVGWWKWTTAS